MIFPWNWFHGKGRGIYYLFVYLVMVIDSILGQQLRANSNSSGRRQTSTLDKFLSRTGCLLPSVILNWNAWNVSLWTILTNLGWQDNIMLIPSVVTLKKDMYIFLENYPVLLLGILFPSNHTFIKVHVAFVFGLQTH